MNANSNDQPIAVVGAGNLVSHLWRGGERQQTADYRFSIFRFKEGVQVTQKFRPSDLSDLVKLCQVLGFAIFDDGWISDDDRIALLSLVEDLDELTQNWSETSDG